MRKQLIKLFITFINSLSEKKELKPLLKRLGIGKSQKKSYEKLSLKKRKKFLIDRLDELSTKKLKGIALCVCLDNWNQFIKITKQVSKSIDKMSRFSDEMVGKMALELEFITEGVSLSPTVINALKEHSGKDPDDEVRYVYQLVSHTQHEINSIDGIGPKSMLSIKELLGYSELKYETKIHPKDLKRIKRKIKENEDERRVD